VYPLVIVGDRGRLAAVLQCLSVCICCSEFQCVSVPGRRSVYLLQCDTVRIRWLLSVTEIN